MDNYDSYGFVAYSSAFDYITPIIMLGLTILVLFAIHKLIEKKD